MEVARGSAPFFYIVPVNTWKRKNFVYKIPGVILIVFSWISGFTHGPWKV